MLTLHGPVAPLGSPEAMVMAAAGHASLALRRVHDLCSRFDPRGGRIGRRRRAGGDPTGRRVPQELPVTAGTSSSACVGDGALPSSTQQILTASSWTSQSRHGVRSSAFWVPMDGPSISMLGTRISTIAFPMLVLSLGMWFDGSGRADWRKSSLCSSNGVRVETNLPVSLFRAAV